jgi:GntR family transcriptional regulator
MPDRSAQTGPSTALTGVLARFEANGRTLLPKHARLRAALAEAIEAGELPLGARLSGERELSETLGVSLGTTQKALGHLVADGFLVRRHGDGTFVASGRRPLGDSWHYRFYDRDGVTELPVYTTILERAITGEDGPWVAALGPDPKGYVRLIRRADVADRLSCYGEIYLPASRFQRLMRFSERRLNDVNYKLLLEQEFAAPTLSAQGCAWTRPIPPRIGRLIGAAPGAWGMEIHITAFSIGHRPITFQKMVVPPTEYGLKVDYVAPSARPAPRRRGA